MKFIIQIKSDHNSFLIDLINIDNNDKIQTPYNDDKIDKKLKKDTTKK